MKKKTLIICSPVNIRSKSWEPRPWLEVKNNAATDTHEIMIYDRIGKSYWDDSGVSAKEFNDALKAIPPTANILVRINSHGGNVWDGVAIYNMLAARAHYVTTRVEGVAASIASVIFMAGGKREMPANALLMMHEPSTVVEANAEEMRAVADMLDKHAVAIASVYVDCSNKSMKEIRDMMKAVTWMTGEDAKECGMCEDVTDAIDIQASVKPEEFESFLNLPKALTTTKQKKTIPADNKGGAKKENIMNREEMIALLQAAGQTVDNAITDADLKKRVQELAKSKPANANTPPPSAPPTTVDNETSRRLAELENERKAERKLAIENRVKQLQPNRFPVALVDDYVVMAQNDPKFLAKLEAMPVEDVGVAPVAVSIEGGDSIADIQNHILNNGTNLVAHFIGKNAGRRVEVRDCREIQRGAAIVANTYRKHRSKLLEVLNTNTIDANLQRVVILQEMLRAYETPLLPLTAFSTVFANQPLEGLDEIDIPYFPLQGAGGTKQFLYANGYTFTGNSNQGVVRLKIGGDGVAANADANFGNAGGGGNVTAGTCRGRIYTDLNFTSYERRRQPFLNLEKLFLMRAEQLAIDLFTTFVSKVLINTNYATALTRAAAGFTSDDLARLWETASTAKWPNAGRSIALDHRYNTSLIIDPAFKAVYAAGSDEALRDASIKRAYGFDKMDFVPNLEDYGAENVTGWIAHQSGAAFGTSPIMPTEEVRALLSRYDVITNPMTGIAFEYRRWGNANGDSTNEIIETNYGGAVLRAESIQLIKKA